ncbi:MAG TPA: extracellular solute-binding protein [Beijerinckiaceae bacterium]|jgi:iron(III) transport system substrate-binding protein|nr:extracellular solute-binding protein [Beijerinckiaceae bacterium]
MSSRAQFVNALLVALCLGGLANSGAKAQDLSKAEQIYADLAKLPAAERAKKIEEGARQEGQINIVQTLRDELGNGQIRLFQQAYPFLKVDWTASLGSADGAERLYAEETAGRHLTDAINVAAADLTQLLDHNMLARYASPEEERILPQYRSAADPDHRYVLSFFDLNGMIYNTNLVPPDKAPKQWMDLCNPFFKGNISFDPVLARQVAGFYKMFGDKTVDFFRCLGANKPIVQRGFSQRFTLMMAGDHMVVGDGYTYQAVLEKRKRPDAPIDFVKTAPFLAGFGGLALNRETQHPYATALFADWMLSDAAQGYLAQQLRGPVTLKHPYMPDGATFVVMPNLPSNVIDPLVAEWRHDIEGVN